MNFEVVSTGDRPVCGIMSPNLRLNQRGYTLAGVLALLAVMSILMALSVPLWSRVRMRDKEEELIFRGNEYIEAIARYHQKFGSYPPDLETLEKLKFIRKLYADPMTKSGKWKVLNPEALLQTGAAGVINQPGGKKDDRDRSGLNDEEGNEEEDNRNSSFGNSNGNSNSSDPWGSSGLGEADDENKDEEEEVETVGPVVGVVSRSKKASMKILNGQSYYNKWVFVYALPQQQQQQRQPRQPGGNQQQQQGGTQGGSGGV